jgi:ATP-dependent helicase/DNAse subunit B
VRSVLQIACFGLAARFDGWPCSRTGLACLSPHEADEVEDYVLLHRVRGWRWESAEPWAYRRDLTRSGGDNRRRPARLPPASDRAERVDRLRRRVADHLKPLLQLSPLNHSNDAPAVRPDPRRPVRSLRRRQTLTGWYAGRDRRRRPGAAREHERIWGELTALLSQMVDLLGEEP